jgi:hypothetical protein
MTARYNISLHNELVCNNKMRFIAQFPTSPYDSNHVGTKHHNLPLQGRRIGVVVNRRPAAARCGRPCYNTSLRDGLVRNNMMRLGAQRRTLPYSDHLAGAARHTIPLRAPRHWVHNERSFTTCRGRLCTDAHLTAISGDW